MVSENKKFVTEARLDAIARDLVSDHMVDCMTLSREDSLEALSVRTRDFMINCNANTEEEIEIASAKVRAVTLEVMSAILKGVEDGKAKQ
jgi:hypothetical protein